MPNDAHDIAGVATSIALFVGTAARGPVSLPVRLRSVADVERQHGPPEAGALLGDALRHFFDNGGSEALGVRVAAADARAAVARLGGLTLTAASPGEWADAYRVRLTRRADDAKRFRLEVLHAPSGDAVVERFDDLAMTKRSARFVERVVNGESSLITVHASGTRVPANRVVALGALAKGTDGAPLAPGDAAFHAAVAALFGAGSVTDRIDHYDIVCVPGLADPATIALLQADCRRRRAFLVVDAPADASVATVAAFAAALAGADAINAALYFPWLRVADPLTGAVRAVPPSGFVAGVFARTDTQRGVWKAPAGADARVSGALALALSPSDADAARLGALGVDCLRSIGAQGIVVWGARTLAGGDGGDASWKYVAVRRLAIWIEESVARGVRWAVDEPNDETLWAHLRAAVCAFLDGLWRAGAFTGATPREAYFVRCDRTTMTADDVARGIVRIEIGIAPTRPAEFVVLALAQAAKPPP